MIYMDGLVLKVLVTFLKLQQVDLTGLFKMILADFHRTCFLLIPVNKTEEEDESR